MRTRSRLLFGTAFVALLLAVSALPGSAAPEKIFSLAMDENTIASGATKTFGATFKNTTPGNSTFNSVKLTAPDGFTLANPSISASSTPQTSAAFAVVGNTVSVTGLNAVKRNEFVKVSVSATAPSVNGCTDGSGTWSGEAWTGSNTSGNTFRENESINVMTTITVNCSIQFTSGGSPSDGVVDTPLTSSNGDVEVEVLKNGSRDGDFTGGVTVSIANGGDPTVLSGTTTRNASGGLASFDDLEIDTTGTYTLKATSGSLEATSSSFTIFGDGIECDQTVGATETTGTSPSTVEFSRLDEGACEDAVPYSLIVVGGDEVQLLKDDQVVRDQGAIFRLEITWGTESDSYPDFGETTFDIDFNGIEDFTPDFCARDEDDNALPPNNPNASNQYWPDGGEQPWCIDTVTWNGDYVKESFLGAGDPAIKRK